MIKEKIIDIPYHSQYGVEDEKWKDNLCGLACVLMIADYFGQKDDELTLNSLLKEGIAINGHSDKYGWLHESLVRILRNHGIHAYSEEFKTMNFDNGEMVQGSDTDRFIRHGLAKIVEEIQKGNPIIASVEKGFDENKSSHLVVVCGYKYLEDDSESLQGLYINDSDNRSKDKKAIFIPIDHFLRYWKKLAIFSYKLD